MSTIEIILVVSCIANLFLAGAFLTNLTEANQYRKFYAHALNRLAYMEEKAEKYKRWWINAKVKSVCECDSLDSLNYGYGFAKCFDCGKIKDI